MKLIDIEIEDGGKGREEISKETYTESEDMDDRAQRPRESRPYRVKDKQVLRKEQSKVFRLRLDNRCK